MPKTGPMILREARDAANLTREQMEALMHVSASTIKAWEYGERKPDSGDVVKMGQIVRDESLWPRWMCAVDDEYARRHPYAQPSQTPMEAVVRVALASADITRMMDPVVRDLADGKIDDREFFSRFVRLLRESESAHRAARETLKKGGIDEWKPVS